MYGAFQWQISRGIFHRRLDRPPNPSTRSSQITTLNSRVNRASCAHEVASRPTNSRHRNDVTPRHDLAVRRSRVSCWPWKAPGWTTGTHPPSRGSGPGPPKPIPPVPVPSLILCRPVIRWREARNDGSGPTGTERSRAGPRTTAGRTPSGTVPHPHSPTSPLTGSDNTGPAPQFSQEGIEARIPHDPPEIREIRSLDPF